MGSSNAPPPIPHVVDLFGLRRLPVPQLPMPDEIFSSWFTRLAKANALRVHQLSASLTGRGRQLFAGDPDRGIWSTPGHKLADLCGISSGLVEQTYLKSYVGNLWPDLSEKGIWRHILPISNQMHIGVRPSLQYCPQCLSEGPEPYFRKHWRLSFCVVCDIHRVRLRDRCPYCDANIAPHRVDFDARPGHFSTAITSCYVCKQGLIDGDPTTEKDEELLQLQNLLLCTLDRGWIVIGGRCVHGVLFFEGLRMLLSLLDDHTSSALRRSLGFPDLSDGFTRARYGGIESRSLDHRHALMRMVARLLKNWPETAIDCIKGNGLSSTRINHFAWKRFDAPFWLWEPIHMALDRTMYTPTDAEMHNAASYLFRTSPKPFLRDLCALLNMSGATTRTARIAIVWRRFSEA